MDQARRQKQYVQRLQSNHNLVIMGEYWALIGLGLDFCKFFKAIFWKNKH